MNKYEQVSTVLKGKALFKRSKDGKTAEFKVSWFKPSPDGIGLVAKSRKNAIRIEDFGEWA